MKAVAIGECVLVRAGYSEGGALAGVGEVVMLDIMAERDDNGWQAGVTPAPSDFSCPAPRSFVALISRVRALVDVLKEAEGRRVFLDSRGRAEGAEAEVTCFL